MCYFISLNFTLNRGRYDKLKGFLKCKAFFVGDVLSIVFYSKNCPYSFEGTCVGIRKKALLSPNTSFLVQGYAVRVYMVSIFSYYLNRLYNMVFLYYKKNMDFLIKTSKSLFFLR